MCHNLITPGLFFLPKSLVGLEANSYFFVLKTWLLSQRDKRLTCVRKAEAKKGKRAPEAGAFCIFLVTGTLVMLEILQAKLCPAGKVFVFSPQNLLCQQSLVSRALQQFLPDSQVLMRLQTGFWLGRNWKSKSSWVSYQQDKEAATGWNQASPGLTFKKVTNFYVFPPFGKGTALSYRNKNKIWN